MMQKCLWLGVIVSGLLFSGCFDREISNEGPEAYGANGLSAPSVYKIAPRAPRSMGYPGIAMANVPVATMPVLPPVDKVYPENAIRLRQPILSGVNPDLVVKRPMPVEGLDPRAPMPIEQQVYGGRYKGEAADKPYVYIEGDSVRVSVNNHPEFNGVSEIEADGKIKIPGTEDYVIARGRDDQQIQLAIARTIRPYVRKQAVVRVQAEVAQGGYYSIFGGIRNQGRFPMGRKAIRLSEAVFRADSELLAQAKTANAMANDQLRQGFEHKRGGWLGEVVLVTPHQNFPEVKEYNVARSLFGGKLDDDPYLKPGQIIIVRDRSNIELESYIRNITAGLKPGQKLLTPVPFSKPVPVVTVQNKQTQQKAEPEAPVYREKVEERGKIEKQEHGPATALKDMMGL